MISMPTKEALLRLEEEAKQHIAETYVSASCVDEWKEDSTGSFELNYYQVITHDDKGTAIIAICAYVKRESVTQTFKHFPILLATNIEGVWSFRPDILLRVWK